MAGQTLSGYYMKLLEAAIGFGATSSKQRNATSELVECLHNTHGTVVLDKAIKLMVEKVIETGSWSFLVEVFYAGDKGRIGQRVVNMLMVVSAEEKRVILLFLKALYAMTDALDMDNMDFVINSEFYFLMCILESEAVDAQTKADCIQEFFSVRCESVPALIIPEVQQAIYCQFVLTSSEIKNVLYRMGSEHQVALIKALQAKTDTECQNLALIFATLLDRWDLAGDAEKKSITGKPALFVFDLAWSARALKYAASFLQKFMGSGHDTLEAELTVTCKRVTRDFSREKQNTENLLSQCLAECRCNRLFSAGALFALCAGDRKEVQRMVARAAESEKGGNLKTVINQVIYKEDWFLVLQILSVLQGEVKASMMNLILERAADRCLDKKAKYVIEKLISICGPEHKQVLEEEVLHQIVEQCSSSLFCTFVDKDPIDLSRVQGQITGTLFSTIVTLLAHHTSYRLRARIDRRMTHDLTIMLRKCIEAGLSTQPYSYTNGPFVETPLSVAVRTRNLDLVKLLYRLGAVSNKELHEASHNEMFVMFLDKNKELREYVDLKASNPRGLQDLCCLSVSRYIGCRADRKHRALSLDLPMHLVEQVLFYDVKF